MAQLIIMYKLFTNLILIFVIITLEAFSMVYSQAGDTISGIGAIPEAQTWYKCSRAPTNYISYEMKMVATPEDPSQDFGTISVGNHPKQYNVIGLLTFVSNYTAIQSLINPDRPAVIYREELSCATLPVQECSKSTKPPLTVSDILCLAIVNPNQNETKFTASISFDQNAPQPILTIPPGLPDNTTSSSNSSPSPSATSNKCSSNDNVSSYCINIANRIDISDFGYLLVLSLLFSIFISIIM